MTHQASVASVSYWLLCSLRGRRENIGHLMVHTEDCFGENLELLMSLFPGVGERVLLLPGQPFYKLKSVLSWGVGGKAVDVPCSVGCPLG